jgi:tetratricopeptide (TPR) repeat protein
MHSLGEAVLAAGDSDRALSLADECLALAERTDAKKNVVKALRLRGQALMAKDRLDKAHDELATALELAKTSGNPPQLWKTWATVGELHALRGEQERSIDAFQEAASVISTVAAGLTDDKLRNTFISSYPARAIEAAADGRSDAVEARR